MLYAPDILPRHYTPTTPDSGSQDLLSEAIEICLRSHRSGRASQAAEFAHIEDSAKRKAGRHQVSRLVRPLEQKALFEMANPRRLIYNNQAFTDKWIKHRKQGGAENDVYFNRKTGEWFKRNNLAYHSSYLEFFYRLRLHNHYFATCPIKLLGFVVDDNMLKPVTAQPDIASKRGATREEVSEFMTRHGFQLEPGSDNYYDANNGIRIEDLHDENVLVTEHGLEFIDPVLYLDERDKKRRISQLTEHQHSTLLGALLTEATS